ncbi:UDP-N-acetylmuramoyl-tripeptide--D-alanyl-D-alanine ligase [Brevibacillus choshinensis]|uniref:UDP-N-acetylmuramoyl-tripeptide--D-alanyl-D- alanine ligase n=1 Tax=Brevibacillus choshinensis TaxID=54911 RepID=UPI002E2459DE|nr:UDP-N-acetylmuramoyl-tripeptide--D-alanyl-D-alanine ligase [Brevibacillus choshinensis]MED4754107.1 UDP-N-acetylmuramoyl-tripeptide--D-alanyl-D-alanine ligase [Brevibacillus choshinensis]MED4779238.1 UDP-N-acetylmuramoyl-tripeptide--D-alanyl-D-alanine ligase [Brevibacillus choshinensis]
MKGIGKRNAKTKAKVQPRKTLILQKPVISVTGSAGKTTTKEMISSILSRRWNIYKSLYNKNFLGNTRAHARRITEEHKAVVLEYGILGSGHIKRHCEMIQPSIGVITNIGTAHIGNFGGKMSGIAMAKSELIRYMNATGRVFLNQDCPYSREMTKQPYVGAFVGTFTTVGIEQEADYRATNIQIDDQGIRFSCLLDGTLEDFYLPTLGEHNIYNALFAIAVTHSLGFSAQTIREGLLTFRPQRKRLTHYRFANNVQIFDDTYSSNPDAAKAAIDVLCQVGSGKKVAVLATMLEMGNYDVKGHEDVGQYLSQKNVDYLYTLGTSARHIARAAIRSGFPANRVVHCQTKERLHRLLSKRIGPDTTFLVKGSHRLKMGETVLFLSKETAKVRQHKK